MPTATGSNLPQARASSGSLGSGIPAMSPRYFPSCDDPFRGELGGAAGGVGAPPRLRSISERARCR